MEQSLISFDLIESIGLGLGLGIAVGFRVVVPFWVLSVAAFFGHLPLQENMRWLGSETALIGLASFILFSFNQKGNRMKFQLEFIR